MHVDGLPYRSIWINADGWSIDVIDQRQLPHSFEILNPDGSVYVSEWNALTGQQIIPRYLSSRWKN